MSKLKSNLHRAVSTLGLSALVLSGIRIPVWGIFSSKGTQTLSASVTVSGGGIIIRAQTLPAQALFGSNLVVPVTVTNNGAPINPNNLRVDIVYQLVGTSSGTLTTPIVVPITFVPGVGSGNTLQGTAIVPRSALLPIQQGGSVTYVFQAQQVGTAGGVMLNSASAQAPAISNISSLSTLPSPFITSIRDPWCDAVGPAGGIVSASGLAVGSGGTAVALAPGVVPAPGNLCIHFENADALPSGPGGTKAAAVYTITLENTSLAGTAQLALAYPADINGKVLDVGSDPASLGIYWLDQSNVNGEWRPLSRSTLDSTLHTLTGTTGHFSTFGLFPAGALGAADLRPSERIITPNGDGLNDVAHFSGVDEVKIFDVRGRRVRTLPGPAPMWDGRDDDGKIVESGVYIYQYTVSGERVSGVIGVAK